MSAAEKLRALEQFDYLSAVTEIAALFPEIVAVVERLEHLIYDNGTRSRQQMWRDAESALVALDKKLSQP